jgi:myo-inositol-1(or 4)-monophosphatase
MSGTPAWRRLLTEASSRVQAKTSRISRTGRSMKSVGVGASGDVTLQADREAEMEIFKALTQIKGIRIVSEEAGEWGESNARIVAVVDPLDGSSNFSRGIPFYCTSVAVATGDSLAEVTWGLIRNLVTGEVYWAEKGKGAFKDGSRMSTSSTADLKEAVLGVDISRSPAALVASLAPLLSGAKRHVHFGANALELCLLAEGKTDAFVDVRGKMRMTDFAAGYLIAKEAGAEISMNHPPDSLGLNMKTRISFVAAGTNRLHAEVSKLVPLGALAS